MMGAWNDGHGRPASAGAPPRGCGRGPWRRTARWRAADPSGRCRAV